MILATCEGRVKMTTQRRNPKCLPLKNWPDASARHQIINQIIFEEYLLACQQKRADWVNKAQERLRFYGIELSARTLDNYRLQIKRGDRNAMASSSFGGKLYKELGSRVGKEGMYKQIDLLVSLYLNTVHYVGLPANQLVYMTQKYDSVVACEIDKKMFPFMFLLNRHFAHSKATLLQEDIIGFLESTSDKFSLIDLDLMQHLYKEDAERIGAAVARVVSPVAVVCIASCIGRAQTEEEYRQVMPSTLIKALEENGCTVIAHYSDGYSDRVTPMRYELLVVECQQKTWNLQRDLLE